MDVRLTSSDFDQVFLSKVSFTKQNHLKIIGNCDTDELCLRAVLAFKMLNVTKLYFLTAV